MKHKEWYYCIDDDYAWESSEQGQLKKHKGHSITIEYNPSLIARITWKIKRMFK